MSLQLKKLVSRKFPSKCRVEITETSVQLNGVEITIMYDGNMLIIVVSDYDNIFQRFKNRKTWQLRVLEIFRHNIHTLHFQQLPCINFCGRFITIHGRALYGREDPSFKKNWVTIFDVHWDLFKRPQICSYNTWKQWGGCLYKRCVCCVLW